MRTRADHLQATGEPDRILLVSCYELGQEPLGLTVPAGVLSRAGFSARLLDLAVSPITPDAFAHADLIAISTPMHTALRLGAQVATIARRANPDAHLCFFGLYSELNESHLVPAVADSCLGAEFEGPLLSLARRIAATRAAGSGRPRHVTADKRTTPVARSPGRALDLTPLRGGLALRERYAKLALGDERRKVGYVATTRGCKHLCRHCPLPPVYQGSFYAHPAARVLDDIAAAVEDGARHITFADPDFLNGPTHALRVTREMARRFPSLTFDYTSKVEHLLRHDHVVGELQDVGNLFVVSAVESFNDGVLAALRKGHTRADALEVIRRFRDRDLVLRPTLVPFTPWETRATYAEIFDIVDGEGLADRVDPVQYSIRLLVPEGSLLIDADEMRPHLGTFDEAKFSYAWAHPDAAMDQLQSGVAREAEQSARTGAQPEEAFARIRALAGPVRPHGSRTRRAGRVPRLTEDWFC